MPHQPIGRQPRIGRAQRRNDPGQGVILRGLVGNRIGALEFDADGKIIARRPPLEVRFAGMPGTVREPYILRDRAIAPDGQVRGNTQRRHLGKIGMHVNR